VYAVLFCNVVSAWIVSAMEILALPLLSGDNFE
jgi:hypothetical protein